MEVCGDGGQYCGGGGGGGGRAKDWPWVVVLMGANIVLLGTFIGLVFSWTFDVSLGVSTYIGLEVTICGHSRFLDEIQHISKVEKQRKILPMKNYSEAHGSVSLDMANKIH